MVSIWDGAFVLFVIRLAGLIPWPESIPASHRMWIARFGQLTPILITPPKMEESRS
jgi:hypothetical protein